MTESNYLYRVNEEHSMMAQASDLGNSAEQGFLSWLLFKENLESGQLENLTLKTSVHLL